MRLLFLSLLTALINVLCAAETERDWTKLVLSTGTIQGRIFSSSGNQTVYLFLGIPYAEPPIGDLRYRAPVVKKKWDGELNATEYKALCMSTKTVDKTAPNPRNMSEDCLHVNVFTTDKCLKKVNCPVMFYIYGGMWSYGSPFNFSDEALTENFILKEIVLVTVTFRMGSLGFFNTGNQTAAAKNFGLLDIIHALRWTQREINLFGGDKKRVTIMGHSSGGIAVELISLSPITDGLFHQTISMSGPAGMIVLRADTNVAQSRMMTVMAGCATEEEWNAGDSFEYIIDCMRNKSSTELIDIQRRLEDSGNMFNGPAIDGTDGVLPGALEDLLRRRRAYRQLIGTTNREFRASKVIIDDQGKIINESLLLETCLKFARIRNFRHLMAVAQKCVDEYSKRPLDIADLFDDMVMYLPTYDSSEAMRQKGATVYKYSFEYNQIGSAYGKVKKDPNIESPFHSEDLVYVMGQGHGIFTAKDKKISRIYSGIFADFIKTGDPSPPNSEKWQPTDDRNNYYEIDFDEDMNMPGNTDGYHANAVKFWTKTAPNFDQLFSKWSINVTGEDLGEDDLKQDTHTKRSMDLVSQMSKVVHSERRIIDKHGFNWMLSLGLVTGVSILVSILLMLNRSKRRRYKSLSETSSLNPSSVKTYG